MLKKRIEVNLTEQEWQFVQWMAERDGVSIQRELQQFFWVDFEQCKELYLEEMWMEEGKKSGHRG